jgi:hypothetical protein
MAARSKLNFLSVKALGKPTMAGWSNLIFLIKPQWPPGQINFFAGWPQRPKAQWPGGQNYIFLQVGRTGPKHNGRRVKTKFSVGWPHQAKAQLLGGQNYIFRVARSLRGQNDNF